MKKLSPDSNVNELPEPPVVKAVNGVATVSLIADINPATGLPGFEYEGIHGIAPTIEVSAGTTLRRRHHRRFAGHRRPGGGYEPALSRARLGAEKARRRRHRSTRKTGAKASLRSTRPTHQEPGLYWYHPHVHGETSYQVGEGGMSGAIVVLGIEKHFPRSLR